MDKKLLDYFNGDELAASVWQGKYAAEGEESPDDMHHRLAKEFFRIDKKYQETETSKENLSEYGKTRENLTEGGIYELFKDFKRIVPQGRVMAGLGDSNSYKSLSNCLRLPSPNDSYSSIMFVDTLLVSAAKRGMGFGLGLSKLRPKDTKVKNAASTTTGAVSFMERFSNSTREVGQQSRRGASLQDIDIRHPDSLDFIKSKEDLTKITGSNISIFLDDDFLKAVEYDEDYILRFPCNVDKYNIPILEDTKYINQLEYNVLEEVSMIDNFDFFDGYIKKVRAREYFNAIVNTALKTSEPGVFFKNTMINYSPSNVYNKYYENGTNACFAYDTQILTAEGYKKIGDLEGQELDFINSIGEIVLGSVFKSGERNIFTLHLSDGTKLKTTIDHRFMLTDGSTKEAQFITKEDRLMPFYSINNDYNEFVNYGFIQGDGQTGRLDSERHLELEVNIGNNDADIAKIFKVDHGKVRYYLGGYNDILKELGFDSSALPDRWLPDSFNKWEDRNKRMFLKGLWSANGGIIKGHRISLKSSCKQLIFQLHEVLNEFGIDSYYTTNKAKYIEFSNGTYLCQESYDLNITRYKSVLKFAELIGFVHEYKQNALSELILAKAPKLITSHVNGVEDVYDFTLYDNTHWGVIEGVIAHNCGEEPMADFDTCRLILLNLLGFVDSPFSTDAKIAYNDLYKCAYEQTRLLDNLVDLEIEYGYRILNKIQSDPEPIHEKATEIYLWEQIIDMAKTGRRVGGGITALGDMLAALGVKYGSDESLAIIEEVMQIKMKAELDATIDLAILRGKFDGFDANLELKGNDWYKFVENKFPDQFNRMQKYGRRNVNFSTIAPAGSVSILTKTTSGCEPLFQPYYTRRKKINPNDKNSKVDYIDDLGDKWQEYFVLHPKFKEWIASQAEDKDLILWYGLSDLSKESLQGWFEKSPWYGSCANDIDWKSRLKVQSILQKYTTAAISVTINLPKDTSFDTLYNLYFEAWFYGLKGITCYLDGSRSGVLVTDTTKKDDFPKNVAPKRPKKLKTKVLRFMNNKEKWIAFVGLYNDHPYEIFTGLIEGLEIPQNVQEGYIVKLKQEGESKFYFNWENGEIEISNAFDPIYWNYAKLISGVLRHGMSLPNLISLIEGLKLDDSSLHTWKHGVIRALKQFVKDGVETDEKCPECGNKLIYEEGCKKCSCGYNKCG